MKILIIAHNQLEIVKNQINLLKAISKVEDRDFILVDNFSSDGTQEWLTSQSNIDYVICDEKKENYSTIINLIVREFSGNEDLFVICPSVILLPGCLEKIQYQLRNNDKIGAIYPQVFKNNTYTYEEAMQIATEEQQVNLLRRLEIDDVAVVLNGKMLSAIGELDEEINCVECIFTDLCFSAIKKDFACCELQGAFAYKFGEETEWDRTEYNTGMSYLRNKWGMNYFSGVPNTGMLKMIDVEPDKEISVLEVGCDCGANLLWVKNTFKNSKIYGIEINPVSADVARHLFDVATCDIEKREKPFDETKFDYIIFGDVLEHLRNPAGTIDFCKELLNPNGKIIASIPNLQHYSVLHALLNGDFHYTDTGLLDKTHIHFFTYNEILRMFTGEGYDMLRIEYTTVEDVPGRKDAIVNQLLSIAEDAKPFMFEAFQYIVLAQVKG